MSKRFLGSWLRLKAVTGFILLCGLSLITAFPVAHPTDEEHIKAFRDSTIEQWRNRYGNNPDLQVAFIEINFHKEPKCFVEDEGAVISPVGLDLFDAQEILEVESYPAFLRRLTVDRITCLSWKYAGMVNRDQRYIALVLAKRPKRRKPDLPTNPTYSSLPADLREEALATAGDLEEHKLHECVDFPSWVKEVAGEPPYTDQFMHIIRAVGAKIIQGGQKKQSDDICAGLREDKLSIHRAQVLAVMAAREIDIPAFAFATASPKEIYLVGTYCDQSGWLLVDLENYEEGYFTGGPVLLTKAPIITPFEGSRHDFWFPYGAAYVKGGWGDNIMTISRTDWKGRLPLSKLPTDTTEARSSFLSETRK